MTTYRWAVVGPFGKIITDISKEYSKDELVKAWQDWFEDGYTVKRFKLVECEEGEGDGED